jgi:hypothetical protein
MSEIIFDLEDSDLEIGRIIVKEDSTLAFQGVANDCARLLIAAIMQTGEGEIPCHVNIKETKIVFSEGGVINLINEAPIAPSFTIFMEALECAWRGYYVSLCRERSASKPKKYARSKSSERV